MVSNQPQDNGEPPKRGFFASIFTIPTAIFNQGADHGRQWRDMAGNEDDHDRRRCKRRRSQDAQDSASSPHQTESSQGDVDDWFKSVAKEFEKREQLAKEFYDSWGASERNLESPKSSSSPSANPSSPEHIPDVEHPFDRFFGWGKGPETPDSLFQQVFQMTSNLENEIAQRFASPVFGIPFVGRMLNPFLNDSIAAGYSPLQLEQQEGFDSSWRIRFEDLVRASNEQPMTSKEEAAQIKGQTWSRWLIEFQSRNQTQSMEKFPSCPISRQNQDSCRTASKCQGDLAKRETNTNGGMANLWRQQERPRASKAPDNDDSSFSSVSSVVETRNSHMNSDGSTNTKICVTKTFADGRVEKTETIQTTPAPKVDQSHEHPFRQSQEANKRGWFWTK